MSPRSDDIRPVFGLEWGEAGIINKPEKNLVHIKRFSNIGIDEREEILDRISRREWLDQIKLRWCPHL